MAVKIRLKRVGKKKKPFYRVVVQDSRVAREGKVIEKLGSYDPLQDPPLFEIDQARTRDWISKGAIPSETVAIYLGKLGLIEPIKLNYTVKKETKEEEAKEEVAENKEEGVKEEPATDKKEIQSEQLETKEESAPKEVTAKDEPAVETKEVKAEGSETKEEPTEKKAEVPKEANA